MDDKAPIDAGQFGLYFQSVPGKSYAILSSGKVLGLIWVMGRGKRTRRRGSSSGACGRDPKWIGLPRRVLKPRAGWPDQDRTRWHSCMEPRFLQVHPGEILPWQKEDGYRAY